MTDRKTYPRRHLPSGYDLYSNTLRHFIRDVRMEFKSPEMPFLIGVLGVGGKVDLENPNLYTPILNGIRMVMAAPAKEDEFKDIVAAVFTEMSWADLQEQAVGKRGQMDREIKKLEKEHGKLDRSEREKL